MKLWKKVNLIPLHAFAIVLSLLLYGYADQATNPEGPGTIAIVSDDNYPPYIFRDSGGKLQGIIVDQWNLWEKKTGIRVNIIGMDWGKAQRFMADGKADVIDTIFHTEERAEKYDFTKPYVTIKVPVFFHNNISGISGPDSLQGFTVGVKEGDACIEILKQHGITTLQVYNSYEEIVQAAVAQKIRVFCMDEPPALYYLYKMNIENEYRRSSSLYTGQFHRAVKKGRQDLLNVIEGGFSKISGDEYAQIDKRWMGSIVGINPAYLRYILYSSVGAALLVVILMLWNYTLRKRVFLKTSELQLTLETLKESEEKYRELVQNANSIILRMDNVGNVTFFNEFAQHFFGYREVEIVGQNVVGTIVPELESTGRDLKQMIEDIGLNPDRYVNNINENVRRNGERVWVAWTNRPILHQNGRVVEILCVGNDITDRKQMETRLDRSYRDWEQIFKAIGHPTIILDREHNILQANQAASTGTGKSNDEILGKKCFDIFHDMNAPPHICPMERLLSYGSMETVEMEMEALGGVFLVSCTPVVDGEGNLEKIIHIATDITERKRAEESLRKSEERLKFVLEGSQLGFWDWNIETDEVIRNERSAEMLGYTLHEIEFSVKQWTDLHHPDDRAAVWKSIDDHLRGLTSVHRMEYRMRAKDGRYRWIFDHAKVVQHDALGKPIRMSGTHTDITERKQAEEALLESEERFSGFFRASPVGTSITRLSDGQFVDINDAFLGLFSYTREEVIGQNPLKLAMWASPEDRAKMVELLQKLGRIQDFETKFRRKSGEIRDVRVSAEVIEVAGERYILGLTHDITERKRALEEKEKLEAQLFQAQKMESVGRLAGGVAHDFNNMLGVIIGRAEMALQQEVSNDKLQHNLKEILNAGLRSADLTRQLLAFARKQTAIPKILDLNDTISGMLKMLRRLIGEDIDLSWQPGLDLWKVKIDPSQVDQILANLAVNARDAISGVGAITMRTENVVIDDSNRAETPEFIPGQYVLLTVSDTGAGISQEVRENIFEPFFTTKELGKGTGLGLSTVYGIVKQNDGFIYVASEPGKGTTFKIYLPRFEAETAQVPSEEVVGKPPTGAETILLVEDDEAILNLGKMILENLGYTVLAAHTPVYALQIVEDHPGDLHLLITDVVMPEMNGRELAEQLSATRPNLRCLYMSGYTADVITHRGILDEGLNFIQKPFGSNDLAAKVRQVLDHLE